LGGEKFADSTIIFRRLTAIARKTSVQLTYAHKQFYLRLIEVAADGKERDGENLVCSLSVAELSVATETPLRTVIQSLARLSDCRVIQRNTVKTFPRSASKTIIFYQFFKKGE
jgi:hypothetical protein